MFSSTKEEIIEVFKQAKNINAAIKKILKQEVQRGSFEERFFKDFRSVVISPRASDLIETFVQKNFPSAERHFMVLAGYIYDAQMVSISSAIIGKYAEEFNRTYSQTGSEITVQDRARFEEIAREAIKMLENGLKENQLPPSSFLKGVLVNRLFTPEVIKELEPLFQ